MCTANVSWSEVNREGRALTVYEKTRREPLVLVVRLRGGRRQAGVRTPTVSGSAVNHVETSSAWDVMRGLTPTGTATAACHPTIRRERSVRHMSTATPRVAGKAAADGRLLERKHGQRTIRRVRCED